MSAVLINAETGEPLPERLQGLLPLLDVVGLETGAGFAAGLRAAGLAELDTAEQIYLAVTVYTGLLAELLAASPAKHRDAVVRSFAATVERALALRERGGRAVS